MLDRLLQVEGAQLELELSVEQVLVDAMGARVRPDDGCDRGEEHDDAGGGLVVHEASHRLDEPLGDEAVGMDPRVVELLFGLLGHECRQVFRCRLCDVPSSAGELFTLFRSGET